MLKISEYLENTRTCGNIIRCPVYTLVVSVENICKRRERSGSTEYAMLCHILHYCIPSSLGWGWAMISEQTDYNLSRCWQILFQCCICSTPPTPVPPFSIENTMEWKVEIQIHFSKLLQVGIKDQQYKHVSNISECTWGLRRGVHIW